MRLSTSYRQILAISVPIMLASATQNVIVLSDNIFLNSVSRLDFAAVGIVGVFYLLIASIGYGFSRGGQIIIARRSGQRAYREVGTSFQSLFFFELALAVGLFIFLQLFSEAFFSLFIDDPEILSRCLAYIYPRSYGVFFSYLGVALISLYTGIARTRFIIYTTLVLTVVNVILNYALIFGKWGMPQMGIAGAGLASTLAEAVAFVMFILYMLFDHSLKKYHLLDFSGLSTYVMQKVFNLSYPIVLQSAVGLGSWFIFFAFVENLGAEELSVSNLIRNVYLILSVPCWGFAAGINTIASGFIGQRKSQAVLPMIKKTALLSTITTALLSLPVVLAPRLVLTPLFGAGDSTLIAEAVPYMPLLFVILVTFAAGSIYMNGLIGIGKTRYALAIQSLMTIFYVIYTYLVLNTFDLGIGWGWAAEIYYWVAMGLLVNWYIKRGNWKYD